MNEKFKQHIGKYGILYFLLALALGLFIGLQWNNWFPDPKTTDTTSRRSMNNVFPGTGRSNGCSCVKGSISNYGLDSGVPCSSWSKYCNGSIN